MFNVKYVSDAVAEYDKVDLEEMGGHYVKTSLKLKIRGKWHTIYERNYGHIYQLSGEFDYTDSEKEKVYEVISAQELLQVAEILKNDERALDILVSYRNAVGIACDVTPIFKSAQQNKILEKKLQSLNQSQVNKDNSLMLLFAEKYDVFEYDSSEIRSSIYEVRVSRTSDKLQIKRNDNWLTLYERYEKDPDFSGDRPYVEQIVEIEHVSDERFTDTADMKRLISLVSDNSRALELLEKYYNKIGYGSEFYYEIQTMIPKENENVASVTNDFVEQSNDAVTDDFVEQSNDAVTDDFVEQSNDAVTDDLDVLPTIRGYNIDDIRKILSSILTNDKVMSVIAEEYNKAINQTDLTLDNETNVKQKYKSR